MSLCEGPEHYVIMSGPSARTVARTPSYERPAVATGQLANWPTSHEPHEELREEYEAEPTAQGPGPRGDLETSSED